MIKVLINFGGKITNERRILPGVYEDNDPALFGLGEYLIANKQAVWVDAAPDSWVLPINDQIAALEAEVEAQVDAEIEAEINYIEGVDYAVEDEPAPEPTRTERKQQNKNKHR
jgi:hypothetical protein